MDANSSLLQYMVDASAIAAALLGTLGALYGAYALYPDALKRFTAAATTGLAGALISGITVGVPALDAAFFPRPGIISFIVGVVVWETYAFFLFVDVSAPSLEELDNPKIDMSIPPWRREKQPADIAAWLWFRVAWVGGLGWAEIALLIAPHRHSIWGYLVLTMLLGGVGGLIFGYRSGTPAVKPPYFSFIGLANIVGVLTIGITSAVFAVSAVLAYVTHTSFGTHIPVVVRELLYIFVTPIPILIVAVGLAPFARWKWSRLSERQYGVIGILLVLLAFLIQVLQPIADIVHIRRS